MITSEYPFIYVTLVDEDKARMYKFSPGIGVLVLRMRDLPATPKEYPNNFTTSWNEPKTQVLLANNDEELVWVPLQHVRFDRSEAIHHTIQTVQVGNDPGQN